MKTYICTVCGYEHIGDTAPEKCPFCKARNRFSELKHEIGPNDDVILLGNGKIKIEPKDSRVLYHYVDSNGVQAGPVYPKEFRKLGINRNTMVWRNGMTKWLPAGQLSELSFCFEQSVQQKVQTPPISERLQSQTNTQQRPDNFMTWAVLATIFCCLPTGIAAIVNANDVDSLWYDGKYNESVEAMKSARKWTFVSLGIGLASYMVLPFFGLPGVLFIQLLVLTGIIANGVTLAVPAMFPKALSPFVYVIIWGLYIFGVIPILFNFCIN